MDYLKQYGPLLSTVIQQQSPVDERWSASFKHVCAFLYDNPNQLSVRKKLSLTDIAGLEILAARYWADRSRRVLPSPPGTVPDPVVSIVLELLFGYESNRLEAMKREHQDSMAAENIVGALLERYIASEAEKVGWCWCAGSFVKATDFVMKSGKYWRALQVKNRSNSENSSSKSVRDNTTIEIWSRTVATTGRTKWDVFPDETLRCVLNEDAFQSFVRKECGH